MHSAVAHLHAEAAPERRQVDSQWCGSHLTVEVRGHRDADRLIGDCEDARDRPILLYATASGQYATQGIPQAIPIVRTFPNLNVGQQAEQRTTPVGASPGVRDI